MNNTCPGYGTKGNLVKGSEDSAVFLLLERIEKIGKGKYKLFFENGESCWVYGYEIRGMHIEENTYISKTVYQQIYCEIIGKRAKKRALHLLEQMDRTEQQLREKLAASDYPQQCIDDAVDYVKSFHYLDDTRYAETFTRYKQDKFSRQQIKQKLMAKGVSKETIEHAIQEEYDADESEHIRKLLEKKKFQPQISDDGEFRRVYQYLLRRGFRSSDILREMKYVGEDW